MGGGSKQSSGEGGVERESTGPGYHLFMASHIEYLDLIPGVKDPTPCVDVRQAVQMYLPRQGNQPSQGRATPQPPPVKNSHT